MTILLRRSVGGSQGNLLRTKYDARAMFAGMILAASVTRSTQAEEMAKSIGMGALPCHHWTEVRNYAQYKEQSPWPLEQWVVGFLSGVRTAGLRMGVNP